MQELACVLAVALVGLLLAALVAFSPWYPPAAAADVEHPPASHGGAAQVV